MSKDNVLKEGTVRRFMTLAGTGVLASDFLTEEASIVKEQEEEMEAGGEEFADLEMEDPAMEDPAMEDPAMDEPEMDEPEEEGGIEDAVRAMVDAIAGVASDFGVDVEVGEEETLSDGDYLPAWAFVEWVNHPRLSTYQPQWDLEVVSESR